MLPAELIAEIVSLVAADRLSSYRRRRNLRLLASVSRLFRPFAEQELFRRVEIKDKEGLASFAHAVKTHDWLATAVRELKVVQLRCAGLTDEVKLAELGSQLPELPRLRQLELVHAGSFLGEDHLPLRADALPFVNWQGLEVLCLTQVALAFSTFPLFSSLRTLSLTDAFLHVFRATNIRALPPKRFPSLRFVELHTNAGSGSRPVVSFHHDLLLPLLPQLLGVTASPIALYKAARARRHRFHQFWQMLHVHDVFLRGELRLVGAQLNAQKPLTVPCGALRLVLPLEWTGNVLAHLRLLDERQRISLAEAWAVGTVDGEELHEQRAKALTQHVLDPRVDVESDEYSARAEWEACCGRWSKVKGAQRTAKGGVMVQ
ncbi:hypothetical protein JCM10213_000011 [Rhodosporidiobolus nylandii]